MTKFPVLLCLLLWGSVGLCNNILVKEIVLKDVNTAAGTMSVQVDVAWENSWRIEGGAFNHDAAWVFLKYMVRGDEWRHASLTGVARTPTGSTVEVASDGKGAMIYMAASGGTAVSYSDLELTWDYAADGLSDADTNRVAVRAFAVEMVYVPQNLFALGGVGTEGQRFYRVDANSSLRDPYTVASEAAIAIGSAVGELYYEAGGQSGDQTGTLPADFPKGFASFYAMKYEVSQQQYVDFYNTLTASQQAALDLTGPTNKNSTAEVNRNAISLQEEGSIASTFLPDLPVNYVRGVQALAFLDWAALRPMTELEFEKLCRGPIDAEANEYAWGSSGIYTDEYIISSAGTPNEAVANADRNGVGVANAVYAATVASSTATQGPLRNGIFANGTEDFNRSETGGSFYGLMELSGNLGELVVTAGTAEGRAFTGNHGDGTLTASGTHDVTGWPATAAGLGSRGGSYGDPTARLTVADRATAASYDAAIQYNGLRGVRTLN